MTEVSTIGLDLAKTVFHVHGVDVAGETVIRRQLRRRQVLPFFRKQPACLVGIEACATSHHWARELGTFGHEVHIMPANTTAIWSAPFWISRPRGRLEFAGAAARMGIEHGLRGHGGKS